MRRERGTRRLSIHLFILLLCASGPTLLPAQSDTAAPTITAVQVSTTQVLAGPQSVDTHFDVSFTDDLSGAWLLEVLLEGPSGGAQTLNGSANSDLSGNLISGTTSNGTLRATLTFPAYVPNGDWTIARIRLRDRAGNFAILLTADLAARSFQTKITVVPAPPTINSLSGSTPGLSQNLIQVGRANATITVRGAGFSSTSKVRLGTTELATTFVDASTLTGVITSDLIKSIGTSAVTVADGARLSDAVDLKMVSRADANATGTLNIGDALVIALSVGGLVRPPVPAGVADVNLSGTLNIGDALVVALFAGGVNANFATPTVSSTSINGTANWGDTITLTGSGFSTVAQDNVVFFSRSDGSFIPAVAESASSSGSQNTLTVTVPANAVSGPIFVKRKDLGLPGQPLAISVANGDMPLYVSRVTPALNLIPDTILTITGTGFDPVPANTVVSFTAGNDTTVPATAISATTTSLTVAVPVGAVSGYLEVALGNRTSNRKSILVSGTPTPLRINHIYYPDFAGEPILIEGTGFNTSQPQQNQVLFTGSSNTQVPATVVVAGRTELIVLVPDSATTGILNVKTNNGQTVSNNYIFSVGSLGPAAAFNGRIEYTYDVLNRLTEVRYPSILIRYAYDPAGNRTSMVVAPNPR